MSVTYDDLGIDSPRLIFDRGIAAIDIITVVRAGEAVASLGFDVQLPSVAQIETPPIFTDLCTVAVTPGPRVTATIDTAKMTWGYKRADAVRRKDFTDYCGQARYGVRFEDRPVDTVNGFLITNIPTRLEDGRTLTMWFAEVPHQVLDSTTYDELFTMAESMSAGFSAEQWLDWVVIPAQQITSQRGMTELLGVNPDIQDITQRFFVALDETGVRVKAETIFLAMAAPPALDPTHHVFGSLHPVVFWLTEPESSLPFAVIATTTDSWIDPDSTISFDDRAFTTR